MSIQMSGGSAPLNPYINKFNELMIALKNYDLFYQDYDFEKIFKLLSDMSSKTYNYMSDAEVYDILKGLLYSKISNADELKQFLLDSLNQYNIRQDELIADFIDTYYHYDQNGVNATVTMQNIYDKYRHWHMENIGFLGISRPRCRQAIANSMKRANYKLNEKRYFVGLSLKQIDDI
jgi:hypothetical protein